MRSAPTSSRRISPCCSLANAGLIHRTAVRAPTAWRRHLGYVLDGLHRGAARTEAPPSPGLRAVRLAMADQAAQFGCT